MSLAATPKVSEREHFSGPRSAGETIGPSTGARGVNRRRWIPGSFVVSLCALGCGATDVGAPCNHGQIDAPTTPTVTFPALACDQLVCVYADDDEPPEDPCETHADCNPVGSGDRFRCESGACVVASTWVLGRSMCSQTCESDADCAGGDPATACESGFACARIQSVGEFCCEKLCVCRDDLDVAGAAMRDELCESGEMTGCCDEDPRPAACGP